MSSCLEDRAGVPRVLIHGCGMGERRLGLNLGKRRARNEDLQTEQRVMRHTMRERTLASLLSRLSALTLCLVTPKPALAPLCTLWGTPVGQGSWETIAAGLRGRSARS